MVVGAAKHDRTQHRGEGFLSPPHVTSRVAAGTGVPRPGVVRKIPVQPLCEVMRRYAKRLGPQGDLQRLEVKVASLGLA